MVDQKRNFPMLPVGHWWALRRKFKQSIPGVVTDNYLATVLSMTVESARTNVLPFLRPLGIVDEDGKPTERAKRWRDDGHYPEICKAITAELYPKELLDAVPDPRTNRDAAKRWFANHTGSGESACNRMVALYTVLVEADPSQQTNGSASKSKDEKPSKPALKVKQPRSSTAAASSPAPSSATNNQPVTPPARNDGPDVSINLQIHISSDASSDQIEQIFAAMAKHIYKRG